MLIEYHESITHKALSEHFDPRAMQAILTANLKQHNLLTGQIGHNEYHYDNNAITESDHYIEEQRGLTLSSLRKDDLPAAWAAFGRLIHTAQDFYAHSNYVDLWLSQFPYGDDVNGQTPPSPSEIAPLIDKLVGSPNLHSGKLYYPLGVLSFIPFVKRLVVPLLPADSHAHMQLDSPARGERFAYAFEAAVKRTQYEFVITVANLSTSQKALFCGES
jgi:hypothetical protein